MTTSTTTEDIHGELSSTPQSTADSNSRQSTARGTNDLGHHATASSGRKGSGGDGNIGSSRTTGIATGNDDNEKRKPNTSEGGSASNSTTRSPHGVGDELTTTSYENYLKNIKLNLSLDFNLGDLSEEQKKNLEDLSKAYALNPSSAIVVVDANMKLALQNIAAKMSPEQRQILGFQLKDLVSSCIMNGEPCDTASDFKQTFDVDYGNCYTFNHGTPAKYTTRRAGSSYGLRMTIISNSTESLPSASEQGVKVVVHGQDIAPFPNVEGHRGSVGEAVSLQLTRSKLSKLGQPYGNCSTLESIAENKLPFYFNGSYSIEGCFRSCFQRNIATACGCADSRFPSPTDMNVPFCDPLEPSKYKCLEAYIEDNGNYFSVNNCSCYDSCEDTTYRAQLSESPWPAGGFFVGGYCPAAKMMDSAECIEFYSNSGMLLEVSYAQLGYDLIEEEPLSTVWSLINELAGNIGLWIGFTMVSFTEILLVGIQICLWICRCPKELPEVPSLRRRNYRIQVDSGSESDGSTSGDAVPGPSGSVHEPYNAYQNACAKPSADSMSRMEPPKNFPNILEETAPTQREFWAMMPAEVYDPKQGYEPVIPVLST